MARFRELCSRLLVGQPASSGHFCQLEVPEQVNVAIERFLVVVLRVRLPPHGPLDEAATVMHKLLGDSHQDFDCRLVWTGDDKNTGLCIRCKSSVSHRLGERPVILRRIGDRGTSRLQSFS